MNNRCPDCCHPERIDARFCGCCEGIAAVTPLALFNRPGLTRLRYRMGTHGEILSSMLARLSSRDYPALAELTTRDTDDPSIALLDGWAVVADVLTFYQERIANEGYLPSAIERRSILELARLVGYKLHPGVASSVFVAYTLDEKFEEETTIPAGSRSQSVPAAGELPQSFETSEDLKARALWNNLKPRLSRPQTANAIRNYDANNTPRPQVWLAGVTTNLKPNDPLLIDFGGGIPEFFRVHRVTPDNGADRTLVNLAQPVAATPGGSAQQREIITALTQRASLQPRNALRLPRALKQQFRSRAETGYAAVKAFAPVLKQTLSKAAANARVSSPSPIRVWALRRTLSLFGHSHPGTPNYTPGEGGTLSVTSYTQPTLGTIWPGAFIGSQNIPTLAVEPQDENIAEASWIAVRYPVLNANCEVTGWTHSVHRVDGVQLTSLSALGTSGKVNLLELAAGNGWLRELSAGDFDRYMSCEPLLRNTTVLAKTEALELAEAPIENLICGGMEDLIELNGFYEGLESGRWVIVAGERDLPGTEGVRFSELAMLAAVTQDVDWSLSSSGEQTHTFIQLAEALEYCFKRDTVTIYGNVVKATHGETRREVLGGGDGAKAMQRFALKQKPVTYTAAANPRGVDSSLEVRVNEVRWHEAEALSGLAPTDRRFVTQTDDEDQTTVIFGNGQQGARLPTGTENVKARYRTGIGRPGNVKAGQISLLADRPLGVKEVINPLRASGGADRENRDQARKHAPLAVTALDRLVSVRDYADFARTFAGIGKACAVELSTGRKPLVHVTIAGADDIPIDETSDLFINLERALRSLGDPFQPAQVAVRELLLMVISARVRIDPDYLWEDVAARLRAALLAAFGFEARELGRHVFLSEVYAVTQAVRGVVYVDIDSFGGVPEKISDYTGERRLLTPDEVTDAVFCIADPAACEYEGHTTAALRVTTRLRGPGAGIAAQVLPVNCAGFDGLRTYPAQLALLSAELPDTLILNPIAD
ncbi:putative baseplate assembly protein [Desulfatitalea tepidiphila]|uniref:putative baseplate assembly protein n=1 Tax=Desulfatitalea tepidiphila TaxID=1185843 RepID=UPI0006B56287|nr:putative baseplate assembly protein [Desulfatitalea tepidiphila]